MRTNLGSRCRFAGECEIFQGKKVVSSIPLAIHRNVFCNRGMKGWKNCEQYAELTAQEVSEKENKL